MGFQSANFLLNLDWVADLDDAHCDAHRPCSVLHRRHVANRAASVAQRCQWTERACNDCCGSYPWRDLLEQLQPFATQVKVRLGKTGDIAARARHACDQTLSDRIDTEQEYDGN